MNKSSKLFSLLKKIEHHLYHSASKIVVVTDSFKKYIIKRDKPHLQYSIDRFDEKDIEGSNSDNNGDEENK